MKIFQIQILTLKDVLSKRTNTGKLWVQYIQFISKIKEFTRAERIGDWKGYLAGMGKMLNLFAATGHINYAKSTRLYRQKMTELETEYSCLYQQFSKKGFHCFRRTDKLRAGLWTDLVIEQTMMRSLKILGWLTRGGGIDKSTRTLLLYLAV